MSVKESLSNPIRVLVADSSQMQLQLLTGALRRRPEFKIDACSLNPEEILKLLADSAHDVALLAIQWQWIDLARYGGSPAYSHFLPESGKDSCA